MGNLRQSYTHIEWDDLEKEILQDKKDGKPESTVISLSVFGKSAAELQAARKALSPFFTEYELRDIDSWIRWKLLKELRQNRKE
jgi:hypothetical protein